MAVTYQSQASATPSSGTTITVTKPSGTVDGDVLVALIVAESSTPGVTITPPAGWTAVGSGGVPSGTNRIGGCWSRVAGGSEPANYTFSINNALIRSVGVLLRYAPQSPTTPPGVIDAAAMAGTVTAPGVAPSLDATGNADTLISLFAAQTTQGSTPTGMIERALILQDNIDVGVYDELLSAPGATGTREWTGSSNARSWSILLLASQAGSRIRMMI